MTSSPKFAPGRPLQLPAALVEALLPGSLSETRRRGGKRPRHCAEGTGHPSWYLTFGGGGLRDERWNRRDLRLLRLDLPHPVHGAGHVHGLVEARAGVVTLEGTAALDE